jgi:hypothetical protein
MPVRHRREAAPVSKRLEWGSARAAAGRVKKIVLKRLQARPMALAIAVASVAAFASFRLFRDN